jgi:hypothetical protein
MIMTCMGVIYFTQEIILGATRVLEFLHRIREIPVRILTPKQTILTEVCHVVCVTIDGVWTGE